MPATEPSQCLKVLASREATHPRLALQVTCLRSNPPTHLPSYPPTFLPSGPLPLLTPYPPCIHRWPPGSLLTTSPLYQAVSDIAGGAISMGGGVLVEQAGNLVISGCSIHANAKVKIQKKVHIYTAVLLLLNLTILITCMQYYPTINYALHVKFSLWYPDT